MLDKPPVDVDHSQKPLQLLDSHWGRFSAYGGDSFFQGADPLLVDLKAKEIQRGDAQDAFIPVNNEAIILEDL